MNGCLSCGFVRLLLSSFAPLRRRGVVSQSLGNLLLSHSSVLEEMLEDLLGCGFGHRSGLGGLVPAGGVLRSRCVLPGGGGFSIIGGFGFRRRRRQGGLRLRDLLLGDERRVDLGE